MSRDVLNVPFVPQESSDLHGYQSKPMSIVCQYTQTLIHSDHHRRHRRRGGDRNLLLGPGATIRVPAAPRPRAPRRPALWGRIGRVGVSGTPDASVKRKHQERRLSAAGRFPGEPRRRYPRSGPCTREGSDTAYAARDLRRSSLRVRRLRPRRIIGLENCVLQHAGDLNYCNTEQEGGGECWVFQLSRLAR